MSRFKQYLINEEGEGGVASTSTGPATTTDNVAKFFDKIRQPLVRRKQLKKKKLLFNKEK